jgi:hypothetical protein
MVKRAGLMGSGIFLCFSMRCMGTKYFLRPGMVVDSDGVFSDEDGFLVDFAAGRLFLAEEEL